MKNTRKMTGLLTALLFTADNPVWVASGLKMPESVEYDWKRERIYVSNINGGVMEQDGNGSIGLLDARGKLVNVDWVTG